MAYCSRLARATLCNIPPDVFTTQLFAHLIIGPALTVHTSHIALCCPGWSHQRAPPCSEQNNLHLSIHKLTCSPKLSLQISSFSCTSYRVKNITYLLTYLQGADPPIRWGKLTTSVQHQDLSLANQPALHFPLGRKQEESKCTVAEKEGWSPKNYNGSLLLLLLASSWHLITTCSLRRPCQLPDQLTNTVDKYSSQIHLRNIVDKYS